MAALGDTGVLERCFCGVGYCRLERTEDDTGEAWRLVCLGCGMRTPWAYLPRTPDTDPPELCEAGWRYLVIIWNTHIGDTTGPRCGFETPPPKAYRPEMAGGVFRGWQR